MLDTRCLSPDFCIMKLEYGAQSELRCRHHRVTNSFTFTFPSLYHSPMAGRKMQENARRKKSRKRHNTVVARKCSTFFSLLFFASLWLSALCFSWQIASDIKFIYAKFARRALSYCPSTKRKTHSTPSTTVHITQGIQYTQCVAYNTPVLASQLLASGGRWRWGRDSSSSSSLWYPRQTQNGYFRKFLQWQSHDLAAKFVCLQRSCCEKYSLPEISCKTVSCLRIWLNEETWASVGGAW